MPTLDLDRLRAYKVPDHRETYDARDTILYALGVGAGLSPDVDELNFVFERDLVALPTMALVLGTPGFWAMDPRAGVDWLQILHGEQKVRLHRPLAPQGEVVGKTTIGEVADKGPGKPAMLKCSRTLSTISGDMIAEIEDVWVLRGAGGFGGSRDLSHDILPPMPDRASDAQLNLPTSLQQALIYRLSGDRNPLHAEPTSARLAGFDRPIMHGLGTMGLIARAVIHLCADGKAARLRAIRLRFTAPVTPGETIRTEVWREADGTVRFRALIVESGVLAIDAGLAELGE